MARLVVVEDLTVLGQLSASRLPRHPARIVDQLDLDRCEEALGHVPTIAAPAHPAEDPFGGEYRLVDEPRRHARPPLTGSGCCLPGRPHHGRRFLQLSLEFHDLVDGFAAGRRPSRIDSHVGVAPGDCPDPVTERLTLRHDTQPPYGGRSSAKPRIYPILWNSRQLYRFRELRHRSCSTARVISDKGKPAARPGRKATGQIEI